MEGLHLCPPAPPFFFFFLLVVFFQMANLCLDYLSLTGLTIFMSVCTRHTCTTARMHTDTAKRPNKQTRVLISLHLLSAWCQLACFKERTAIRGTRRRGVTEGRANVWEWCVCACVCVYEWESPFKEVCEAHCVSVCVVCVRGEWGLFCRPWKKHWDGLLCGVVLHQCVGLFHLWVEINLFLEVSVRLSLPRGYSVVLLWKTMLVCPFCQIPPFIG